MATQTNNEVNVYSRRAGDNPPNRGRADGDANQRQRVRPPYKATSNIPHTDEDVANLAADLGDRNSSDGLKIVLGEPYLFGLALDVYDPVSGQVFVAARPHRKDLGEPQVFLSAEQLASEVAIARAHRATIDRENGVPTEAEKAAREKAAANAKAKEAKEAAAKEAAAKDAAASR